MVSQSDLSSLVSQSGLTAWSQSLVSQSGLSVGREASTQTDRQTDTHTQIETDRQVYIHIDFELSNVIENAFFCLNMGRGSNPKARNERPA